MGGPVENDPVLARMLAKVAAWQAAVDSYRAAKALEGTDSENYQPSGRAAPIELPINAFRGMTLPEAVKLYLQSVRRKQTAQEIAEGLRNGGIESTAKDFGPTVRSTLNWLKKRGELLRFTDGWDLAEAHSVALRNRLANRENNSGTKSGRSKKGKKPTTTKGAVAKAQKKVAKGGGAKAPKGPSLDERILAFLRSHPMSWFTQSEIAQALKEPENGKVVPLAFARLVRYGKVARQDDGRYAAPKAS